MFNPLYLPELRLMLAENDEAGISEFLTELHPASAAEFAEGLSIEETWNLLSKASLDTQAEIFAYFPFSKQMDMVEGAGRERIGAILEQMAPDNRAELLRRIDPELIESLLPLVAKADRHDIRLLLSYPEHSAGSIMTTEYASLPANFTAGEAIARMRTIAPDSETIYYIYVIDEDRRLVGFVSLRDLILAKPTTRISDIMERDVIRVRVDEDQEVLAQKMARYDFLAIPVVDDQNRLVGIVTYDDVMDIVAAEATEDIHRMGAVGQIEDSYLHTPFVTIWQKRAVWLSCLFIAELFTFTVMAHFHDAIAAIVALNFFVPLCISTGGNSGSQAATLITRAMALGQISPQDWWRVLKHELWMGLALGLTLGIVGYVRVALTPADTLGTISRWDLAVVVSGAVAMICLWGTLVGALLPMLFRRLGFDPAFASSPFVATFVDVTGIFIYFTIAQVYLLPPA